MAWQVWSRLFDIFNENIVYPTDLQVFLAIKFKGFRQLKEDKTVMAAC